MVRSLLSWLKLFQNFFSDNSVFKIEGETMKKQSVFQKVKSSIKLVAWFYLTVTSLVLLVMGLLPAVEWGYFNLGIMTLLAIREYGKRYRPPYVPGGGYTTNNGEHDV